MKNNTISKFKYKAVIFDFDDTLFESRLSKWAQHTHVAKKFYNVNLKEETILKHWGKPIHLLAPILYEHTDTWENIHPILQDTKKDFPKIPYTHALQTIQDLIDNGIKVGILSATTKKDIIEDLTRYNFPVKELLIQGSDETNVHKPDPEVFTPILNLLKEMNITNKEIVYVGDSLDDLKAAKGSSVDFIAITQGIYSKEDFDINGANLIIKNINELLEKLK